MEDDKTILKPENKAIKVLVLIAIAVWTFYSSVYDIGRRAFELFFMGCLFAGGTFIVWILHGRPGSLMDEFSKKNRRRNGRASVLLLIAIIAAVIYINNR